MKYLSTSVFSGASNANATGTIIIDANQLVNMSFCPYTANATLVGTFQVQGSNDAPYSSGTRAQFTPTNWANIPNATSTSAAGVFPMIVLSNLSVGYIRVVFTSTSGGTAVVVNCQMSAVSA